MIIFGIGLGIIGLTIIVIIGHLSKQKARKHYENLKKIQNRLELEKKSRKYARKSTPKVPKIKNNG